ncbi:MAG: hypothetical protein ACHQ6U_09950 [Thermodesulfobacteriota bacterium]
MPNYVTPEVFGDLVDQIITLEGEAEVALAQLLGSFLRQKLSSVDMVMTH